MFFSDVVRLINCYIIIIIIYMRYSRPMPNFSGLSYTVLLSEISKPLDMRNLSLGRRHLVNAYKVQAGIGVIAGNTV